MVSVVAVTSLVPDSQHQTHICSGEAGQMSPERVQSFRLAKKSHSISKLPHWRPKRGERGRYFFLNMQHRRVEHALWVFNRSLSPLSGFIVIERERHVITSSNNVIFRATQNHVEFVRGVGLAVNFLPVIFKTIIHRSSAVQLNTEWRKLQTLTLLRSPRMLLRKS